MSSHPLSPIFGTRCRTEAFAIKPAPSGGAQFVHFEAYRDRADADSWTVRRYTVTDNTQTGKSYITSEIVGQRMGFEDAVAMLSRYERNHAENTANFSALFPNAAALRFNHFRAFAEREGYVFDVDGKPHARPARDILPANARFEQKDIEAADQNLQRTEADFGPASTARRLPDTLFIFDAFNRRAIGKNQGNELAGMRVLNLMDTFVGRIEAMNNALTAYTRSHLSQDAAAQITAAEAALTQARHQLRQIAAYGINVQSFEKLTDECGIVIHVIHAQGIYDRLRRQPQHYDDLEAQFKSRATKAMEEYAAMGKKHPHAFKGDEGHVALQEMIIQGGTPALPATIGEFVRRYREQRSLMIAPAKAPPQAPPAP